MNSGERVEADVQPATFSQILTALTGCLVLAVRSPRAFAAIMTGPADSARSRFLPWLLRRRAPSSVAQDNLEIHMAPQEDLLGDASARIQSALSDNTVNGITWDTRLGGRWLGSTFPWPMNAELLDEFANLGGHRRSRAERAGSARHASHRPRQMHLAETLGQAPRQSFERQKTDPRSATAISIVLPTRDRPDLLKACLDSVWKTLRAQDELIIVDHLTQDRTAKALIGSAQSRGARIVREAGPFNYSRLINAGAALASNDHLVLLNNDVNQLSEDWPTVVSGWLDRSDVGVVGADLRYPSGRRQHVGLSLRADGIPSHVDANLRGDGPAGLYQVPREVFAVTGALLGIRREIFEAVGSLDTDLPTDFNDIKLCLSVRARGLRVVWTPSVRAIHHESSSRGRSELNETHTALWARVSEEFGELAVHDPFFPDRADHRKLTWNLDRRLALIPPRSAR